MMRIKGQRGVLLSTWLGPSEPLALHLRQERACCAGVKHMGLEARLPRFEPGQLPLCDLGKLT